MNNSKAIKLQLCIQQNQKQFNLPVFILLNKKKLHVIKNLYRGTGRLIFLDFKLIKYKLEKFSGILNDYKE